MTSLKWFSGLMLPTWGYFPVPVLAVCIEEDALVFSLLSVLRHQ